MVDYSSLENYRAERHRGFESLSLRKAFEEPTDFQQVPFFMQKLLPLIAPPVFFKFI